MAVKQKRKKRLYKLYLTKNATKILCKYCDLNDNCRRRTNKERDEEKGLMTRCLLSPNKKVKKAKIDIVLNKNGIPYELLINKARN